jgi:hypothetical protein
LPTGRHSAGGLLPLVKVFLGSRQNGLTRDTRRDATSGEVKRLKQENADLKRALAEAILDVQKFKKSLGM